MKLQTKAYSYVRMSTDIQLKGDSLKRQKELSKKTEFVIQDGIQCFAKFQNEIQQNLCKHFFLFTQKSKPFSFINIIYLTKQSAQKDLS